MGFLSGVLGAVKDDPSVTTYYTGMETTLQKIKDNMHNPGGLSAAVDAVSTALGEWDGELNKRCTDVKNYFNNLNSDKLTQFNNSLNALNTCEPSDVAARLGDCIEKAKDVSDAFDWAEGAYNQLDKSLTDKSKDLVNNIKVQVKSFVAAAKHEELKTVVETAGRELKTQETQVIAHATHCMTQMRESLDEQMVTLLKNIDTANNKLKQWLAAMGEWINETKTFIAELLQKRADEILYEVNEGAETCKRKQVAQAIQVNELNLEGAVEDLERWNTGS
ncbi:hypothetical protein, conserved [Babesia bigemina]|uniref:Uncharacterized protein n=1 Tax=Babesia bigemina TaxID=5866 RepID=A0A061BIV5_BABBI|nr:hypothetical protein, conserved [Babesia bigemina]CDR71437.1 hypothetical protein, conserved [Babesia bigemina]|eukprot:XP_012770386.1 hypothetical protein, conserved [Babesia bigemina]